MDYLLLRKLLDPPPDDPGQTLRGLWPRLPLVMVAELKTVGRPYRSRGLDQLWAYVHAFFTDPQSGIERRHDLCALLIVPCRTPALDVDAVEMGLVWRDLGSGYAELVGGLFRLYVVEIDVVAEQESDDLLRLFGHGTEHTQEARRFWAEQVGTKEAIMAAHQLEGYDEVVQKFLEQISPEQRLAGLAPEQRLAGLAPEQRLAGLAREQILLALPDDDLRRLPDEYLRNFPEATREAVRKRLNR